MTLLPITRKHVTYNMLEIQHRMTFQEYVASYLEAPSSEIPFLYENNEICLLANSIIVTERVNVISSVTK